MFGELCLSNTLFKRNKRLLYSPLSYLLSIHNIYTIKDIKENSFNRRNYTINKHNRNLEKIDLDLNNNNNTLPLSKINRKNIEILEKLWPKAVIYNSLEINYYKKKLEIELNKLDIINNKKWKWKDLFIIISALSITERNQNIINDLFLYNSKTYYVFSSLLKLSGHYGYPEFSLSLIKYAINNNLYQNNININDYANIIKSCIKSPDITATKYSKIALQLFNDILNKETFILESKFLLSAIIASSNLNFKDHFPKYFKIIDNQMNFLKDMNRNTSTKIIKNKNNNKNRYKLYLTFIQSLCNERKYLEAAYIYEYIEKDSNNFNTLTKDLYIQAIIIYQELNNIEKADKIIQKLNDWSKKTNNNLNTFQYNTILAAYSKNIKYIPLLNNIFNNLVIKRRDRIQLKLPVADTVTYNTFLSAQTRFNKTDEAYHILLKMLESNACVQPNHMSFNIVMQSFAFMGDVHRVNKLYKLAYKNRCNDSKLIETVMLSFTKAGQHNELLDVWYTKRHEYIKSFPLTLKSFHYLLQSCKETKNVKMMEIIIKKFKENGIVPGTIALNYIISTYILGDKLELAENYMKEAESILLSNEISSNNYNEFEKDINLKIINSYTYTCLMQGYYRKKEYKKAIDVFQRYRRLRKNHPNLHNTFYYPMTIMFFMVYDCNMEMENYEYIINLFDKMANSFENRSVMQYFSIQALKACEKLGEWEKALEIYDTYFHQQNIYNDEANLIISKIINEARQSEESLHMNSMTGDSYKTMAIHDRPT